MQTCVLVGATAVGKSAVAQWIAEKNGYDILSADSMLVYRGMDIGTAKPSEAERQRVNYGGIDLVNPDESFSVWDYRENAIRFLMDVEAQGRKSLVTGGTGLYVKCLTDGLDPAPSPDPERREHWSQYFEEHGLERLLAELKSLSEVHYDALEDKANPRRVIRALEKAEAGIEPREVSSRGPAKLLGLSMPPEQLKARIKVRIETMYESGLEEEVGSLIANHATLSVTARQAIGYAEVMDLIDGRCSREEAIERTTIRTRRLAKRQGTWFRHQADVEWIQVDESMTVEDVAAKVMASWTETDIIVDGGGER